jgi:hypothetical protein
MKFMKHIVCPISHEQVNERITRLNAFFTILLIVAGFAFNSVYSLIFLLADFYIRAFTKLNISPVSYFSSNLTSILNLSKKKIGKAQKIFAARLGFAMTFLIVSLFLLELKLAAIIIASILVFFASLEFALAICVGCIIYSYLVLPFYKDK